MADLKSHWKRIEALEVAAPPCLFLPQRSLLVRADEDVIDEWTYECFQRISESPMELKGLQPCYFPPPFLWLCEDGMVIAIAARAVCPQDGRHLALFVDTGWMARADIPDTVHEMWDTLRNKKDIGAQSYADVITDAKRVVTEAMLHMEARALANPDLLSNVPRWQDAIGPGTRSALH